jgi:hypothetical protein
MEWTLDRDVTSIVCVDLGKRGSRLEGIRVLREDLDSRTAPGEGSYN